MSLLKCEFDDLPYGVIAAQAALVTFLYEYRGGDGVVRVGLTKVADIAATFACAFGVGIALCYSCYKIISLFLKKE